MTNLVIKTVEEMAEWQGIKSLKIQKKNKTIIYPSDWNPGVDYDDTDTDNYNNDNDYKKMKIR